MDNSDKFEEAPQVKKVSSNFDDVFYEKQKTIISTNSKEIDEEVIRATTNKLGHNSSEDISKETKMAIQNTIIYQDEELPK